VHPLLQCSVCVCVCVTFVIQNAMRMRRVILSSVVCLLYHIFPHYFINSMIFGKRIEHKTCVLIFFIILSETFLILREYREVFS